jgi:tetratricopeptide (TPR) repeat protein
MRTSEVLADFLQRLEATSGRRSAVGELFAAFDDLPGVQDDPVLALELLDYIADVAIRTGETDLSTHALRRAAEISNDPIGYVALGDCLLSYGQLAEADIAFDHAIRISKESGRLIVYASIAKLRSCVRSKNVGIAAKLLGELIAHMQEQKKHQDDILPETDFVEGLRAIGVEPAILHQYGEFARRLRSMG